MKKGKDLINMDEIMEIMDDDNELIKECFDDFINEYSEMLEHIGAAITSGDSMGLDSHAHKLKGSLKYLAASPVADIAYELEKKGKFGNMEGAEDLFKMLSESCEQLIKFMSSYTP